MTSRAVAVATRTLREAREAYTAARFDDAIELLDALDRSEPLVGLLRSRALMRVGRATDGLRQLLELDVPEVAELAAERGILLGLAFGLTRDYDAGLAELAKARPASVELKADALYFKATIHWMRRENSEAEAALADLLEFQNPNDRGRALILQAWIDLLRQDIEKYVACLVAAMDEFESLGDRADAWHFSRVLDNLAAVCREIKMPDVTERLRRHEATFPWTTNLRGTRATMLRAFGWIDALEGNTIAAFREFKEAAALAPSQAWRLLSMLDRAFLAQSTGEQSFADDQLGESIALAESIDWEKVDDWDRVVLLVLAHLVAQSDPAAAVAYLGRFRTLQGTPRSITLSQDVRMGAYMALSGGMARAKLGDATEAESLLTDAWSVFQAFSYEWRAALAAYHLFGITGAAKWHEIAKRHIRVYPRSWLARLIHANEGVLEIAPRLTPAQRPVFDALCEGASTIAIANRLGRSPHTIRNHISDIFEIFGVRSRAELLALVRKQP